MTAAAAAAFRAHPDVAAVQPNHIRPSMPRRLERSALVGRGTLWGLQKIMVQPAWTNFTSGDGSVVVAKHRHRCELQPPGPRREHVEETR